MRWNCPHCGTNLALADEKLTPNWSFSKCYQCGGFAMVRKPEINLVKVDRAPDGERVLLPEATEAPILPKQAQSRLGAPAVKSPVTKTITPAANPNPAPVNPNRRRAATIPQRPSEWASAGLSALRETIKRETSNPAAANTAPAEAEAPAPIAKVEAPAPAAAILEQAKVESAPPLVMPANQNSIFPNPLPELNHVMPPKPRYLPVAIGVAAALAVISGVYLYIQAQTLIEKAQPKVAVIDRRPAENVEAPAIQPAPPQQIAQAQPRTNPLVQQPIQATAPLRMPQTIDQISASAASAQRTAPIAAPAAPRAADAQKNPSLLIRPKLKSVNYHAGPGIGYPVIGTVSSADTYPVTDWNDRWLKVKVGNASGWVRNDAVLVLINPQNAR